MAGVGEGMMREKEFGEICGKGRPQKYETFIFASVLARRSWP